MTRIDDERGLSQNLSETQTEEEIAYELRKFMEEEANSVSLDRLPRRGFLKRVVQVSLPAGVVLATGGVASACWLCDESYGCQASCLFCHEDSGCQANCLFCHEGSGCQACMGWVAPDCEAGKEEGCGAGQIGCPASR